MTTPNPKDWRPKRPAERAEPDGTDAASAYVMVLGHYDCVFVGPFTDEPEADAWSQADTWIKARIDAWLAANPTPPASAHPNFDFGIVSAEGMRANIREFGDCPLLRPADLARL